MNARTRPWTMWQDWVNLVLGIWLFIVPWVIAPVAAGVTGWNAWLIGAAIFFVSLWALAMPSSPWPEWINIVLGAWLFIAPWVLGYAIGSTRSWDAWIVGVVVVVLATWAVAVKSGYNPARRTGMGQGA